MTGIRPVTVGPVELDTTSNEVYAARFAHLTAREGNKLSPTQAQAAVAAALLRQLDAVVTTARQWDPEIATHGTKRRAGLAVAA